MEGESGVTRSITDELHSSDMQRDQTEGESGVSRNIMDEPDFSDVQRDQMEGESGVIRSIIDELLLRICSEIKLKVAVVLVEV